MYTLADKDASLRGDSKMRIPFILSLTNPYLDKPQLSMTAPISSHAVVRYVP
jgi:hypothetical protein